MYECPLEITDTDLGSIQKCEAVVIREYERRDGSRVAKAVAWGDAGEMKDQAATAGIFLLPVGYRIVRQKMVLVSELLPPVRLE